MDMKEIWTIDCDALFQNYKNFCTWHQGSAFGGLVFGRCTSREIFLVLFVSADILNEATVKFLTSSLSADLELVGNLLIEGEDTPLMGDGFILKTSKEVLDRGDITSFLVCNEMLKFAPKKADGISIRVKVGFECTLRCGVESEDLKSGAEHFISCMDRITFANMEKGIILTRKTNKVEKSYALNDYSRGTLQYKDYIEFTAFYSLTRNTNDDTEDQKMVPIVRITKDDTKFSRVSAVLEVTVPALFGDESNILYDRLQEGLRRRVHGLVYVMINGLKKQKAPLPTHSAVFLPPGWSSFLHIQIPQWSETEQHAYRIRLHKLFNLSLGVPCLRISQAIPFTSIKLLRSPHLSITNFKPVGKTSVVKGPYNYHHYMQGGIDDSGWGCAYRSLQTIWSWFMLNGFTDLPIPSHRDIQKCLVDIGDKDDKFLGSRQWIGSTEIGFVLDNLLHIQSRFIVTNSGKEVANHVRELALHFDTVGTPVMIGGAQLAHTILGVDFNEESGDSHFLVLDPHYTGMEDLHIVIKKGWCEWKPPSFWLPQYFYNIVLPQPPADLI